jgi:hypothetical protein
MKLTIYKFSDEPTTPEVITETSLPETSTPEITHQTASQETTNQTAEKTVSDETNLSHTIASTVSRDNLTSDSTEPTKDVHSTQPDITPQDGSSSNYDSL